MELSLPRAFARILVDPVNRGQVLVGDCETRRVQVRSDVFVRVVEGGGVQEGEMVQGRRRWGGVLVLSLALGLVLAAVLGCLKIAGGVCACCNMEGGRGCSAAVRCT